MALDSIVVKLGVDTSQVIDSYQKLIDLNKRYREQALNATDQASDGFKELTNAIKQNQSILDDYNRSLRKTGEEVALEKLNFALKETAQNTNELRQQQRSLQAAFAKAKFGTAEYEQLRNRLIEVNRQITNQKQVLKELSQTPTPIRPFQLLGNAIGQVAQNINDLKDQQRTLQQALSGTDFGTAEYDRMVARLKEVNTQLRQQGANLKAISDTPISPRPFQVLSNAISGVATNINDLKDQQRTLQQAFNAADFGTPQYERLRVKLAEVNLALKNQRDTVKEATRSLGGINPAARFAADSYGALRQNIKAANDELQRYNIGSREFEQAQARLNNLLQKEIDIRRTQPSLFQTRITQAINESEAVKKLRIQESRLRLEKEKVSKTLGRQSREYKALEKQLISVRKEIERTSNATEKIGQGLSAALTAGAIGAAVFVLNELKDAFVAVIRAGAEFEQRIKNLQSVSRATGAELQALEQEALRLGASTQFSASEVAALETELAKLGFRPEQIVASTEAILDLATALGEDLAETAEVAASTLNIYGLSVQEAARVTDVIALSAATSALDLERFRESIKLVGPIAKTANIDLETTTAVLGKLADNGISGSIAGTSLRRIFSELATEGSKVSKELGFTVRKSDDLLKAFEELNKRTLTLADAKQFFGDNAKSAALSAIQSAAGIRELAKAYQGAEGAAKRAADIQRDTLNNQFKEFLAAIEAVSISITKLATGSLRDFLSGLTSLTVAFNDLISIPISEELESQRKSLNGLVAAVTSANEGTKLRADLVKQLQLQYPDFIKNIDVEKASNDELLGSLKAVNESYFQKVLIQEQEEEVQKRATAAADAYKNVLEETRKATLNVSNAIERYSLDIDRTQAPLVQAQEALRKFNELQQSAAAGSVDARRILSEGGFVDNLRIERALRSSIALLSGATNELTETQEAANESIAQRNQVLDENFESLETDAQRLDALTARLERFNLELSGLEEEREISLASGLDTTDVDARLKALRNNIADTISEIAQIELRLGKNTLTKAEKQGEDLGKAINTGFSKEISKLNKLIRDQIELGNFDAADALLKGFDAFGEEGEAAAKRAAENILKARLAAVNAVLDAEKLLAESEFLLSEQSAQDRIAFEQAKLQAIEKANADKIAILEQSGRDEQNTIQRLQNETIKAQQATNEFILDLQKTLSLERLKAEQEEQTLRINNIRDNEQRLIALREQQFEEELAELKRNQAERRKLLLDSGQLPLQIDAFFRNQQLALEREKQNDILEIQRSSALERTQALQNFYESEGETLRLLQERAVLEQQSVLKQQLDDNEITYKAYLDALAKLEEDASSIRVSPLDSEIEKLEAVKKQLDDLNVDDTIDFDVQLDDALLNLDILQKRLESLNKEADKLKEERRIDIQGNIDDTQQKIDDINERINKFGGVTVATDATELELLEAKLRQLQLQLKGVDEQEIDVTIQAEITATEEAITQTQEVIDAIRNALNRGIINQQAYNDAIARLQQQSNRTFEDAELDRLQILIDIKQKEIDELIAANKRKEDADEVLTSAEIQAVKDAENQKLALENRANEIRIGRAKKTSEELQQIFQERVEKVSEVLQISIEAFDLASQTLNDFNQIQLDALDSQIEAQNDRIDNARENLDELRQEYDRTIKEASDAEAKALKEDFERREIQLQAEIELEKNALTDLEAEREEVERKAFERQKALAIAQATLNGALAITNILANTPDPTGALIAIRIALAGLTTAAQIAVISAQQFGFGGALQELAEQMNVGDAFAPTTLRPQAASYAKGTALKDGLRVIEGGSVPNNGLIQGRPHRRDTSRSGVKAITKSGRLVEFEGNEITTLNGKVRNIFTKRVQQTPFLRKVAMLTSSSRFDPQKHQVGSLVNYLAGGKDWASVAPKFNSSRFEDGGIVYRMTPQMTHWYQAGGLLSSKDVQDATNGLLFTTLNNINTGLETLGRKIDASNSNLENVTTAVREIPPTVISTRKIQEGINLNGQITNNATT